MLFFVSFNVCKLMVMLFFKVDCFVSIGFNLEMVVDFRCIFGKVF